MAEGEYSVRNGATRERSRMLLIDSDNAAGSPRGDVDDAFAIAALLRGGLPVAALASVAGNTEEAAADRNNRTLGALCGYAGRYLRGVRAGEVGDIGDAAERIDRAAELWTGGTGGPLTFLALGPLTNLAAVLARPERGAAIAEAVLVGSNLTSRGRFPPFWPHEFNLTKDGAATRAVFASDLPLTLIPLDVARRLRAGPRDLAELPGALGDFLRRHAARWSRRSRLLRGSPRFPVFDLAAAAYAAAPHLLEVTEGRARLHPNLWVEHGAGERRLRVARDLDAEGVWRWFTALLAG